MPKFSITAYWHMSRSFEVEADTIKEAMEKVEEDEGGKFPAEGGEYIDDSFTINVDCCSEIKDEEDKE